MKFKRPRQLPIPCCVWAMLGADVGMALSIRKNRIPPNRYHRKGLVYIPSIIPPIDDNLLWIFDRKAPSGVDVRRLNEFVNRMKASGAEKSLGIERGSGMLH